MNPAVQKPCVENLNLNFSFWSNEKFASSVMKISL